MWPMMRTLQVECLDVCIHCTLLYRRRSQQRQPLQPRLMYLLRPRPVQVLLLQLLHLLPDHRRPLLLLLLLYRPNLRSFTSKLCSADWPLVHLCCLLWRLSTRYAVDMLFSTSLFVELVNPFSCTLKWVYQSIQCHTGLIHPFNFLTSRHSSTHDWVCWAGHYTLLYSYSYSCHNFIPSSWLFLLLSVIIKVFAVSVKPLNCGWQGALESVYSSWPLLERAMPLFAYFAINFWQSCFGEYC